MDKQSFKLRRKEKKNQKLKRKLPLRLLLKTTNFVPLEFDFPENQILCGIDEAGRGPLAGPVSFALVQFSKSTLESIFAKKILTDLNDSKLLKEKTREKLYLEIFQNAQTIRHQFVSNQYIDRFGLSETIFYSIRKLILKSGLINPFLLIDGNYNFAKKQIDSDFHFDYQSIIKGDTKIASIAAASIIAKVKRDRFMNMAEKKYPNYDFAKHKGYGTKAHIEKIQLYDYSKLHRKTFKLKNGNF